MFRDKEEEVEPFQIDVYDTETWAKSRVTKVKTIGTGRKVDVVFV